MNSLYNFKSNFKIKSENIKSRGLNERKRSNIHILQSALFLANKLNLP